MAVLSGDFLLANACTGLAELKDTVVVHMISQVIGHLMEGEFMKMMFSVDDLNTDFWNELVFKLKGSLMANSCKAALRIVAHSTEVRFSPFYTLRLSNNVGDVVVQWLECWTRRSRAQALAGAPFCML